MATTSEKQAYLKVLKAYKKQNGTLRGAPKFTRYLKEHETGSTQARSQYANLSNKDYVAIRRMRGDKE